MCIFHVPGTVPAMVSGMPTDIPPLTALTPREREVTTLIAEGLTNAEIAQRLVLSPGTVSNHLANIVRALRMKNRVQVAVWAVERGLYRLRRAPEAPTEIRAFQSARAEDIAADAG